MTLSNRENYLRNVTMTGPEWIPMNVHISDATWNEHREALEDVMARHPLIFRDFQKGKRDFANYEFAPAYREGEKLTDSWGCVWMSDINGIEGLVVEHPLDDWSKFADYEVPDPLRTADRGPATWDQDREAIRKRKENGETTSGGVPHGFLFMRLTYLRGFENTMIDIATEEPQLQELIDRIVAHNERLVGAWLEMKPDVVVFGEDLGTQQASVLSPKDFRRWIAPGYRRLIKPCRDAGCQVYLHSDGYIMELVDDLLDCGVTILNPQDLCNGIDNIARHIKGRVCISLDIDRQKIVPFGTRKDIHDLIEEEVRTLGSPKGGLEMIAGIYPPTPPENIDALCEAMTKFRTYWWDGRGA